MDCSTPGFPLHHQLPSSWWCHPTISSSVIPFFSCLQSFPASGSFPMSQFFASGGQSIGASASVWVLSMNIQGWFPLIQTSLISLQFRGLSRVFFNTVLQKHQLFGAQLSLSEKEMATHSSVLARRIPGTGEPGGLPIYGVAQNRTRLKRLSNSSSSRTFSW